MITNEDNNKFITFDRVDLFTELVKNGQIKKLHSVKSNPYPTYCFERTKAVVDIATKFIEHELEAGSTTDTYKGKFDKLVGKSTVIMRNMEAVTQIVSEGYSHMLLKAGIEQNKKKYFMFYANDRIKEIKADYDAKKKAKYEETHTITVQDDKTQEKGEDEVMGKGIYKNLVGENVEYNINRNLPLSKKANLVMEVAGLVVSDDIGYAHIIKKPIFNYCLVKYYTDIELFDSTDDFRIDGIDKFLRENRESVIEPLFKQIGKETYNELKIACDEAIKFRKQTFSNFKDEASDLLQAVREFVLKPDYMVELLKALTDSVNSFASRDDIDMTAVNKLIDIIPIMKEMGSPEVVKAIINK